MSDEGPIEDFRGEPHPQPRVRRGSPEHVAKMNAAREAKRAAESPEERAAREAATREKLRRKVHLSGRKPSGQNKQFKSGYRPSRSKNLSVTDIKKLFLDGTETAVKEIWKIMTHSRSEALRLAASQL